MSIALVQSKAASNLTTTSLSFTGSTTAGNCVIAVTDNIATSVTLGGAAGNFSKLIGNSTSGSIAIWADPSCAGSQTAVAATGGDIFYIYEVSGVAASSVLDKSSSGSGAGTTWSSGATATTTQAAEFWIGAATHGDAGSGFVGLTGPSSPWTNLAGVPALTGVTSAATSGWQITSSTGAATYSGTDTGSDGGGNYAAVVVTLLPVLATTSTGSMSLSGMAMSATAAGGNTTSTGSMSLSKMAMAGTGTTPQFPQALLDFRAELNLNGTWTSITDHVYQRNGAVSVSRGKPDESTVLNTAMANLELNNQDGRFSPRNPLGLYYGSLVRNTPARLSVPSQTNYLRMEGDTTSYVSTPDSAGVSITGDTEIQIDMFITNWAQMTLATKYNDGSSQGSWLLLVLSDGTVAFDWSTDGTNGTLNSAHSTVPLPTGRLALKVTLSVATGTVTFYTAPTISGSYTQLGAAVVLGATSVFDSTEPVRIGYDPNFSNLLPSMQGNVYGFKLISGIGGTVKAFADFTGQSAGTTSFTDSQGNTWTLNGTAEISDRRYRFHGEVASFPQRWDSSGNDVWSPVQASGVTRRLQQGSPAADSSMKRYNRLLSGSAAPVAYWPCEDGSASSQIGATIGNTLLVSGSPNMAASSVFLCSTAIPTLNGSTWSANVARASSTPTVNNMKFLLAIPSGGDTNNAVVARMYTTGTVAQYDLTYFTASSGTLSLTGYNSSGSQLFSNSFATSINGKDILAAMLLVKNGTGVDFDFQWLDQAVPGSSNAGGATQASASVDQITRVVINPDGALTGSAVGHIMVGTSNDLTSYMNPFNAWQGETAAARLARVCTEEGLAYRIYGPPDKTQAMGAQTAKTIMGMIQEVEDADRGMLFEPRQVLGIGYRTRESIENQSPTVTLSYTSGDLGQDSSTSLEPTDDDQFTRNDVTISRINGSSSRQTQTTGTLSVQAPPSGVGTYDYSQSYSLYTDHQTNNLAGWIMHIGTTDEPRYPSIPVRLARAELSGNSAKFYGLQDLDQGDYLAVTSPPVWLPPGNIKQIVAGTKELMGGFVFDIQFSCIPELPYEIGVIGSGATSDNRVDTDGSTLHAGCTSVATSITVDTTTPAANSVNLWTTVAADFPFDIMIGGERMTVSNITGSSSPQTFTVTRAVNGVVKAHNALEAVNVYADAIVAIDDPY